jgi:uncharacterized ion transporter superfamily protein YfcC
MTHAFAIVISSQLGNNMNKFAKALILAVVIATPASMATQIVQAGTFTKTQPSVVAKVTPSTTKANTKTHRNRHKHKTHKKGTSASTPKAVSNVKDSPKK